MKWTTQELEPANGKREALAPILASLREQPGRWAELDRYPLDRIASARSRGCQIMRRHAVEYAVETSGSEAVLYLRAPAAGV